MLYMYSGLFLLVGHAFVIVKDGNQQCWEYDFAEKSLQKVVQFLNDNDVNNKRLERVEMEVKDRIKQVEETLTTKLENMTQIKVQEMEGTLKNTTKKVEESLEEINEFRTLMSTTLAEFKERFQSDTHALLMIQTEQLEKMKAQLKTPTILFKAKDATVKTYHSGSTLVFPSIIVNEGGGYNSRTGIFSAPVTGVYMFDMQYCLKQRKRLVVNIVAAGKLISATYGIEGDYHAECRSSSGSAALQAGDQVMVQIRDKGSWTVIYPDENSNHHWTFFSGVLVHI